MKYIETSGNTKLQLITEESDPGIWNSATNNGQWWDEYGPTMGNSYKAILAAEHKERIYPLFKDCPNARCDYSAPFHPIDGGDKYEALEAEISNGKIHLLTKRIPSMYSVHEFDIKNTKLSVYRNGTAEGTKRITSEIEESSPLMDKYYGLPDHWKDFQSKYNFFEVFGGVSQKADEPGDAKNSKGIDEITGTSSNDQLKGKKVSVSLYGYQGNDKLIGSKKDDILDGGEGNDKLKGGRGADVYILSSGKDKFIGFKLQEGDTIEIESSINFQVSSSKKDAKIIHDEGMTVVKKISASDLESAIEIV